MMQACDLEAPGYPAVVLRLRALTGADELALEGTGLAAAIGLLTRLGDLEIESLTLSQIDRALAGLYQMLYGDTADCQVTCRACGEAYEFTLDLPAIISAQDSERPGPPDDTGCWVLPGGARLRAPRPADLAGDPGDLASRVTLSGTADISEIAAFLERAAPVLTLDLDAPCPACDHAATVRFDLADYLTRRLTAERPFLIREAHLIAARYGWSHAEIMGLTRTDRRAYAGLIEAERARLSRRQTA
jgi:hypothetical protein